MSKILKIGIPIATQDGLIQVAFIIITIIANRRGLTDAAAVGIVEKIISFLFLVPSSMLSTVSALGAQNIGAGKPERARLTLRYAAFMAICFGAVVVFLMQFAAEPVVSCLQTAPELTARKSCGWEASICADMSGTVFSQEFISASAATSVPAENPVFPSCTILPPFFWYASRAFILLLSGFRIRCSLWGWQPLWGLFFP